MGEIYNEEIMADGWVKLFRVSLKSSSFCDPFIWQVWCWCLLKAQHVQQQFPFNGSDCVLQPGQFITGRDSALRDMNPRKLKHGLTAQRYRTALSYLKSTNRITTKTTNKFTIITILNWSTYQKSTNKLTNKQPTSNQQATTYKNVKNDKNKEIGQEKKSNTEALKRLRADLIQKKILR